MEFTEFHNWVYKEIGLSLNSYKPTQLNRRIGSLMERVGVKTLEEYTKLLKEDAVEREKFMDHITINVTEFFRNPEFFEALRKNLLSEIIPNRNNIKIWSAGSSMGCEAYSLAMMFDDMNDKVSYSILATDIDKNILAKARKGVYSAADVKTLDKKYLDLIHCRNVIIYFKDEVKQKIIEDFIKSLKVGGLLFVGATESINTYKTSGLEKLSPFIYKKI